MSFTIEMLGAVTRIVVHDKCPDDLASAAILLDAFGGRLTSKNVTFLEHGTEFYEKRTAAPGQLFCDITPPPERTKEFIAAGALVLDHHEPEKVAPYGERGVHASEPGVSGALLAFREVWMPFKGQRSVVFDLLSQTNHIESFATLAGISDTWQKNNARFNDAYGQAAALMFWPCWEFLDDVATRGLARAWSMREELTPSLLTKLRDDALGFITEQELFRSSRGLTVAIVGTKHTSDAAKMHADAFAFTPRPEHAPDVLIGFRYFVDHGVRKIELSCRSISDLNVRPFCTHFGGGGHLQAAGVTLSVSVNETNPYEMIRRLWNHWEETL